VLVPCTVVLLGRWNWWPSKLSMDEPSPDAVGTTADALGLATPDKPVGPAAPDGSAAPDASGPTDTPTDTESRRNS
jgi:hypothetical protein